MSNISTGSASTPILVSQTKDATNTGAHGDEYEANIVALQALRLHFKLKSNNFMISSNDKEGGKFDDVVVVYYDEEGVRHEFVIQIKHAEENDSNSSKPKNKSKKQQEEETKILTMIMLLSISPQQKISLVKIFAKYRESNFKDKKIILFTNRVLNFEKTPDCYRKIMEPKRCQIEKGKKEFVYFDVEAQKDFMLTSYGENYKINVDKSPEFMKIFIDNFFKLVKLQKSEEEMIKVEDEIKSFLNNLTLSVGQLSEDKVERKIDEIIREKFSDEIDVRLVKFEIRDLFKIKKGKIETVTYKEIDKVFHEVSRNPILVALRRIPFEIRTEMEEYSFREEFIENLRREIANQKQVLINCRDDLTKTICRAFYQLFSDDEIKKGKVICVSSKSLMSEKENILKVSESFEYLLINDENEKVNSDCELISELQALSQNTNLRIVFVTSFFTEIESFKSLKMENVIKHFEKSFQGKLFNSSPISFQNQLVYPSEIFPSLASFVASVDDKTLVRLLANNLSIGGEIKDPNFSEEFYIERKYLCENSSDSSGYLEQNINHATKEANVLKTNKFVENLLNLAEKNQAKPILIHDMAGMGKSTEITQIGLKIKEIRKSSWVLKIELGSENFLRAFNAWRHKNLTFANFLKNFLDDSIEWKIFENLYERGKVAVLLDGFDEINSAIFDEVLINLFKKILEEDLHRNIFVVTSRTNLIDDLINAEIKIKRRTERNDNILKKLKLELKQKYGKEALVCKLKAFDESDQVEFMFNNISKKLDQLNLEQQLESLHQGFDLRNLCQNLIEKWSRDIIESSEFLGVPLQIKMLTEIFEFDIIESVKQGIIPKIPEILNHTQLFRTFIDTKIKVLYRDKKESAEDIFTKMVLGEINIHEILLNLACDSLNGNYLTETMFKKNVKKLEISEELQKIMIDLGLIRNFSYNNYAIFLHKAYPEFLVAKKFIEIIFGDTDEKLLDSLTGLNFKVFENVLMNDNQMVLKFIDEFLKLKGMPPLNGMRLISQFDKKNSNRLEECLAVLFGEGLVNLSLLVLECFIIKKKFFKLIISVFSHLSSFYGASNFENFIKISSQILQKVFDVYESEAQNGQRYIIQYVVLCTIKIMCRYGSSLKDECEKSWNTILKWKALQDSNNSQELIIERLVDINYKLSALCEEQFIQFCKRLDFNLIDTLLKCHGNVPYVVLLEHSGCDDAIDILRLWADEKGLKLDEITKNEIEKNPAGALDFFICNISSAHNDAKFLPPGVILKYAKENVENFEGSYFPFITNSDYCCENGTCNKLKIAKEFFSNNLQTEYNELVGLWKEKAFKFCKLWDECCIKELDFTEDETSNIIDFVATALIGFIELNELSISSLNLNVCKFIHAFELKLEKTYAYYMNKEINSKHLKELKQRISELKFEQLKDKKICSEHDCRSCFFCIKSNHKFCNLFCLLPFN